MQVAHFLEADLQPWGAALAAALFAPDPAQQPPASTASAAGAAAVSGSASLRESAWHCLKELSPLHGALDAVMRASELPLLEQLPRTPAEWQPAVIGSRAVAGALELSYHEAAACCDAMHAVRGVHALALHSQDCVAAYAAADVPATAQFAEAVEAVGARVCTAVAALSSLRTLKLGLHRNVKGRAVKVPLTLLPALQRLSQLAVLELHGRELDFDELAAPLRSLTTLTRLALVDTNRSWGGARAPRGAALASALAHLPGLADLWLRGATSSMLGPAFGPLTALTSLDVGRMSTHDNDVKAVAAGLGRLSRLAVLRLQYDRARDIHAALAPALGNLTALTVLDLSDWHRVDDNAEALAAALQRLWRLAALSLRAIDIGATGAAALAPALGTLTALTLLDLGHNSVHANGVEALAPALSRLSRLEHLCLHRNSVGATGAAALAPPIAQLTGLTLLDLRNNDIGAGGAASLAPALGRLTRLASLNLAANNVGAAGAAALAPCIAPLMKLTRLDLEVNDVGEQGAASLAPVLRGLKQLRLLDLGHNDFDDGVLHPALALARSRARSTCNKYLNAGLHQVRQ